MKLSHPHFYFNENSISLSRALKLFSFFSIVFLAWLWGWKSSGGLENTMGWDWMPLGYRYILNTGVGEWPIDREGMYYILGMQSFLNVPGTSITLGSGYEIHRLLYSFLLRSFWFFEPVVACWLFDILMWLMAALSAAYICSKLSINKFAPWLGALCVIGGQGFMYAIGETMSHMMGYVSGFYIAALICYFRTWEPECKWSQDLIVYAFIGIWQLGYSTAWFYLPLAVGCTLIRIYLSLRAKRGNLEGVYRKSIFIMMGKLFVLVMICVLPFILLVTISSLFTQTAGDFQDIFLANPQNQIDLSDWIKKFLIVLLDGVTSLGPFLVLSIIWLAYKAIQERTFAFNFILVVFLIQIAGMTILLINKAGRGYATFNLNFIPIIAMALMLTNLMAKNRWMGKILVIAFMMLYFIYPNASKLGSRLPNLGFHTGFLRNQTTKWENYDVSTLR